MIWGVEPTSTRLKLMGVSHHQPSSFSLYPLVIGDSYRKSPCLKTVNHLFLWSIFHGFHSKLLFYHILPEAKIAITSRPRFKPRIDPRSLVMKVMQRLSECWVWRIGGWRPNGDLTKKNNDLKNLYRIQPTTIGRGMLIGKIITSIAMLMGKMMIIHWNVWITTENGENLR